jgi:ribosomal-protein-alanine N-acetyltransferase
MGNHSLFVVEPMTLSDIDQIMEIEQVAFSAPWSARAYRYEVAQSDHSIMVVVRPAPRWGSTFGRKLQRLLGSDPGPVLGYAGAWKLVDEVHVSTIAVHPRFRRRGLGELLLISLLERGMEAGMLRATLEVRLSNVAAQTLYRKYGFETVSRQRAYYSDNQEDALLMATPQLKSHSFVMQLRERRERLAAQLQEQREGSDVPPGRSA